MRTDFLDLSAWAAWFAALDREFFFLLALPFVVAVIGVWSWWNDKEQIDRDYEAAAARAAEQKRREDDERREGAQVSHHGLR